MDAEELRTIEQLQENPRDIEQPEPAPEAARVGPQAKIIGTVALVATIAACLVAGPLLTGGGDKQDNTQQAQTNTQQPSQRQQELEEKEQKRKVQAALGRQKQVVKPGDTTQQGKDEAEPGKNGDATPSPTPQVTSTSQTVAAPRRTLPRPTRTTPSVSLDPPTTSRTRASRHIALAQNSLPVNTTAEQREKESFEDYISRMRNYASFSGKGEEGTIPESVTQPLLVDDDSTIPVANDAGLQPLVTEAALPLESGALNANAQAIGPGATFKAKLVSSAAWSQEVPLEGATVIAQLQQEMGAIPKGTMITLAVEKADNSGFIALKPQTATWEGQTISLPQSIQVSASSGKPLIAKQKGNGRGFGARDLLAPLLGAARSGATFINRPRSQSTISTEGIAQASTDNSGGSLLAALGGGLADQVLERAQQQAQGLENTRTPYFLLPAGKTIEFLVTENVHL